MPNIPRFSLKDMARILRGEAPELLNAAAQHEHELANAAQEAGTMTKKFEEATPEARNFLEQGEYFQKGAEPVGQVQDAMHNIPSEPHVAPKVEPADVNFGKSEPVAGDVTNVTREAPTQMAMESSGQTVTQAISPEEIQALPLAQKASVLDWVRKNPGKTITAGVLGGLGIGGMMATSAPQPTKEAPVPASIQTRQSEPSMYQNRKGYGTEEIPDTNKVKEGAAQASVQPTGASLKTSGVASKSASGITPISSEVKPVANQESDGYDTEGTKANLIKAQQEKNDLQRAGRTGSALELMSSGLINAASGMHVKPEGQKVWGDLEKAGEEKVKDFEARVEQEKTDPASEHSAQFRNFIKQFGVKIPDDMSAESASKIMPYAYQKFAAEEARKAAAIERATQRDFLREQKEEDRDLKRDMAEASGSKKSAAAATKLYSTIAKQSDPAQASSRNAMGRSAIIVQRAEAIQELINQAKKQKGGADSRQMQEVAKSLDSMLSGGMGTVTGTHELVPETLRGKFAKLQEYVTNIPTGLEQQKFLQRVEETVQREHEVAKKQRDAYIQSAAVPLKQFDEENGTDYFNKLMKERGVSGGNGMSEEDQSGSKTIVKKGYNAKTNQTQLVYSDGTKEVVEGKR